VGRPRLVNSQETVSPGFSLTILPSTKYLTPSNLLRSGLSATETTCQPDDKAAPDDDDDTPEGRPVFASLESAEDELETTLGLEDLVVSFDGPLAEVSPPATCRRASNTLLSSASAILSFDLIYLLYASIN